MRQQRQLMIGTVPLILSLEFIQAIRCYKEGVVLLTQEINTSHTQCHSLSGIFYGFRTLVITEQPLSS